MSPSGVRIDLERAPVGAEAEVGWLPLYCYAVGWDTTQVAPASQVPVLQIPGDEVSEYARRGVEIPN